MEETIYDLIRSNVKQLGGHTYALNGYFDHSHLVTSVPATIALATFIGKVKGASSAIFNKKYPGTPIYWQEDYSVFSCDAHCLNRHVSYVRNQKEHHSQNTTIEMLEFAAQNELPTCLREAEVAYECFISS